MITSHYFQSSDKLFQFIIETIAKIVSKKLYWIISKKLPKLVTFAAEYLDARHSLTYLTNGTRVREEGITNRTATQIVFAGVAFEYGKMLSSKITVIRLSSPFVLFVIPEGRSTARRYHRCTSNESSTRRSNVQDQKREKEKQEREGTGSGEEKDRQRLSFILAAS